MNRSLVVLSGMVDSTIQENCPLDRVLVFNTIQELASYIENTPIRADAMYITRDVLGVTVNTSLKVLIEILSHPFLVVTEVIYMTERGSREIASINFMLEENPDLKWNIQIGSLTREYVIGMITGTLRADDIKPRRVTVYRQTKSEYLKEKLKREEDLSEHYKSEEERLSDIPYEEPIEPIIIGGEPICKLLTITGIPSKERTLFVLLLAQYTSFQGKTLLVERDLDYLTLTDLMARAKIPYMEIKLSEVYNNCDFTFRRIRRCSDNIILITDDTREQHDYTFICNFLYNNLSDNLAYMIIERELEEVIRTDTVTIVIPNNVVDVLKTTERLPAIGTEQIRVALVNASSVDEIAIPNTKQAKMLLKDILQVQDLNLQNIRIKSLKLGGVVHDLRMFT